MELTVNNVSYNLVLHQQNPSLPCLLMLHGFMGSGRVFSHLLPRLSSFCNPVTLDLLGHGDTGAPPQAERFSLEYQLEDLLGVINALAPSNLFLHGYSMGGRLALRFALEHPSLISGLILESTNYGIEDEEQQKRRLKLDEQRAKSITNDYDAFLNEWSKLDLFDNGLPVPTDLHEHYRKIQSLQNPAAMAKSLRGFGTATMPSVKDRLHQLDRPVLLLAGAEDPKYRGIMNEMETLIPNSKFYIIRNAGHRIHLEHPLAFLDQLKAFILCAS